NEAAVNARRGRGVEEGVLLEEGGGRPQRMHTGAVPPLPTPPGTVAHQPAQSPPLACVTAAHPTPPRVARPQPTCPLPTLHRRPGDTPAPVSEPARPRTLTPGPRVGPRAAFRIYLSRAGAGNGHVRSLGPAWEAVTPPRRTGKNKEQSDVQ